MLHVTMSNLRVKSYILCTLHRWEIVDHSRSKLHETRLFVIHVPDVRVISMVEYKGVGIRIS